MGAREAMLGRVRRVPGFAFDAALALVALLVSVLEIASPSSNSFPGGAATVLIRLLSGLAGPS